MNPPVADKLRGMVSQGNWERAAAMLQRVEPWLAADALMSLPFEDQEPLFRRLPVDFAAALAGQFPTITPTCCYSRCPPSNSTPSSTA